MRARAASVLVRRIATVAGIGSAAAGEVLDDLDRRGGGSPHVGLVLLLAADLLGEPARRAVEATDGRALEEPETRTAKAALAQQLAPYVAQAVMAEAAARHK
ncbi:hypothetical protein [Microtetraspora fusca]|uniref:hypothetical protein n=1 Tax=Microtetraspora fusca TaxID=1997 RepID=UPI000830AF49|nr:hypothetical protein [Microtetraspora fusca]